MADNQFDAFFRERSTPGQASTDVLRAETLGRVSPDPVQENQFDKFLRQRTDTDELNAVLKSAAEANPDETARARRLATDTQLPVGTVERNLPEVERRERAKRTASNISKAPATSRFLRDRENAVVAHDDVENLSTLENLAAGTGENVFDVAKGFNATVDTVTRAMKAPFRELDKLLGIDPGPESPGLATEILGVADALQELFGLREPGQTPTADIKDVSLGYRQMTSWEDFKESPLSNFLPFALETGLVSTPEMALAVANLPIFIASKTGQIAGKRVENDGRDDLTVNDLLSALPASIASALLERVGARGILGLDDALIKPGVLEVAKATAKGAAKEGLTELPQEILESTGETLGTEKGFNLAETLERGAIGLVAGVGFGGSVRAATATAQSVSKSRQAKRDQQVIAALGDSAKASKLRDRLPERYRDFVARVREAGAVENVYVDAEALATLMQSGTIDPLSEDIVDIEDRISEARSTGQPVAIPLEDYQTFIAGTEAHGVLSADIKFHADGFTANEADRFNADVRDIFETEQNEDLRAQAIDREVQAPSERVFDNVREQLIAAGQRPDAATQQAAIHRAHAKVLQERYGVDPSEIYGDLAIKGPLPETLASPVDPLDLIIDRARRGIEAGDRRLFGESLQDLARRVGIRDDRGDLASQDIDRNLKPFQRRMLREDGVSLDDFAQLASEAGFFTGMDAETRADIADVIDALVGTDLFLEGGGDIAEQARTRATNDLIEVLNRLGVSLDLGNEDIKAALDSAATVDGGVVFDQPDGDLPRGSIQFFQDGRTIINLGQTADLSTFLHESGHLFVRNLGDLAETNEQASADLGAMLRFAEVETVEAFQRTGPQEKLARAFEAYVREGNAPSPELQGAFARFRAWLLNIYRSLRSLDVELNEEVIGVFDRLLATDQEITEAEAINRFEVQPAVSDLMTDQQRAAYQKAAKEATDQAIFQLEKRKIAEETREETARWKEEFETVRAEVEASTNSQPVYRALDALRDRQNGVFLSRDAVKDLVGDEGVRRLPSGLTRAQNGVHPDFIAEQHGFSSGDEMLMALMNAAKNKTERAKLVADEATERMIDRHGSLKDNEAQAAEAASDVVHNDKRGQFLAMELVAITRRSGGEATPASVAKAAAKQIIAAKKSKDATRPGQFAAAELKASRDATRALLKEDLPAAAEAKRQQLLNHYLFQESIKARDELDGMVRFFNKFPVKSIDPEYSGQINGLLERYDFRRAVSLKEIERRKSIAAFVAEQNEANQPVNIPDVLLNDARRQHFKDTSMEELRGLQDSVRHLEHLGRLKNRLLTDRARRELDDTVNTMADSIRENWDGEFRTQSRSQTPFERKADWFKSKASLRRVEFMMRELDGFKPGPMQEILFGTISDADDNLQERRGAAATQIRDIFKPYKWREAKQLFTRKTFIPEINDSLTHESIISAALNVGNQDNRAKLLKGTGWGEPGLDAVLAKMSERDWKLVQDIWDYIDTFWPETVALDKETKGVAAPKVEADAVETPFGTLKGGYYPLKYSTRTSDRALRNSTEDLYKRMLMGDIGRPTTNQGRTKERLAPTQGLDVRLDLGVFFEAIDETMHDLSFRKAAVDASKMLNHPEMTKALRETVGEPRVDILRDWLKDSVAGDVSGVSSFGDKAFAFARKRTTIMAMGHKLSTALVQPLGYSQTMARFIQDAGVGPGLRYAAKGIRDFYGSPIVKARFVHERSAFMRERAQTYDRDVHDAVKGLKKGPLSYYEDSFFWHIAKMQQAVDMPTWLGAFEWSMDAQPEKGEEGAIKHADSVVRTSQGGGAAKDLAPIQRGGEGFRMLTMFQTYFSAMNNMIIDEARMLKRNPTPRQIAQFSTNMFLLTVVPSVLMNGLYAAAGVGGPDDDESWGEWMARDWALQLVGGLPVIRDIASATIGDFRFEFSPVASSVKKAVGFFDQAGQILFDDGEVDRPFVSSGLTFAGLASPVPLPVGQLMVMGDYFTDFFDGKKDGFNPVEAFVKRDYRN